MSKVLPIIEMPAKEPEPEIAKPPNGPVKENILPETGDGNMDIINEIQEKKVEFDDDIINVEEREVPCEDEVFTDPPAPKMKPILDEQPSEQPSEFEPAKKGKRKYTRKAPMSQKQKEHLARIRQIAIEKRKAEKERKIIAKEEAVIEKAEKKIFEKKRKEEQKEQELINNPPPQKVVQQNGFTKEDLDNAVLSAITQYDTLRKQEKKEKRAREAKQREEEKMRATLQRAIQPQQQRNDPWRSLFT
jgi:hypothetical protein